MVSRQPLLLVVGADRREFAAFEKVECAAPAAGLRWQAETTLPLGPAWLAAHGPGRRNAAYAVRAACARQPVAAVVSTGFVGALNETLSLADVFLATRVVQHEPRREYAVRLPAWSGERGLARGLLLTVDEVVQTAQRKGELRLLGADAVDMEASAVAEEAAVRELPFFCVRVVSDEAGVSFPIDFNRARRPDGTFSGWRVAAQAMVRPSRWKRLRRLKSDSERAAASLAAFFRCAEFGV